MSRWLVCGEGNNDSIMFSDDQGSTWISSGNSKEIFPATASCVAYSPELGLWMAGGYTTEADPFSLAYSNDAITWTGVEGSKTLMSNINDVYWNGTRFVAVGNGGDNNSTNAYSDDGINWIASSVFTISGLEVYYSPEQSLWVSVGSGAENIFSSNDGISWSAGISGPIQPLSCIVWSPEKSLWVTGIAVQKTNTNVFRTSLNGINWGYDVDTGFEGNVKGVTVNQKKRFVGVADNGSILTSTNPSTVSSWKEKTGILNSGESIDWSPYDNLFVAVGGEKIVSSRNAFSWTDISSGTLLTNHLNIAFDMKPAVTLKGLTSDQIVGVMVGSIVVSLLMIMIVAMLS